MECSTIVPIWSCPHCAIKIKYRTQNENAKATTTFGNVCVCVLVSHDTSENELSNNLIANVKSDIRYRSSVAATVQCSNWTNYNFDV